MRVAIVTESFLPQINGVTNSVLRVCEQLRRQGHEAMVVAPGSGPTEWAGVPVVRTPSMPMPGYREFRLALRFRAMAATLRDFAPQVVHLASPALLGAQGAAAARRLGIPSVAVYQTDLAGFARRYHLECAQEAVWRRLRKVHDAAARTLAPSWHAVRQLEENGVGRVARWARGVDLERFHPKRRDASIRRALAPDGELIVGYVGRLAHEKQLGLLSDVQHVSGIKLVIVGDGPQRRQLEARLPAATFLGLQGGTQLAATFASLDVFVHTGSHETFCQAAQEALASGVPVVAPAAGGLLDFVAHRSNGLLFESGSREGITRAVQGLLEDERSRTAMATHARESVQGRSWEVIGRELTGHYREVS
jgi:phosphatidylinositol alpha 1,6-mannosyltransferase